MQLTQQNSNNDLDLNVTGDDHTISVTQNGDNNVADITIDGTAPTDLQLDQTGDNLSYILNQYCVNANGCAITVTQN